MCAFFCAQQDAGEATASWLEMGIDFSEKRPQRNAKKCHPGSAKTEIKVKPKTRSPLCAFLRFRNMPEKPPTSGWKWE